MSKRTSIVKSLVDQFKTISISNGFNTDLFTNAYPFIKFWDEVNDFPCIYVTPGQERREYLPSNFTWCHFKINIKVYCKSENPQDELESLIADVEKVIENNRQLIYDSTDPSNKTVEILIDSIATDEGILHPFGVGDITLLVQYEKRP